MQYKIFGLLLCITGNVFGITLDEAYKRCKHVTREELEPCVVQLINDLRPLIRAGIPELGIKGSKVYCEPYGYDVREGRDNYMATFFDNMVIRGYHDFEMKYLKVVYDENVAAWSVLFPKMHATSRYIMDAKVLYFPLYGNGTVFTNIDNLQFNGISKLDVKKIKGNWRLQEVHTDLTFAYENIVIKFSNLCDGSEAMEAAASQFMESNVDALMNMMRPSGRKLFREFTANMVNNVLSKISLEDLAGSQYLKEAFEL